MVDDDKRGMVMSIYIMAFIGVAPIGNLAAGFLAHRFGAHVTVLIGGLVCLLTSALFARKLPDIRKLVRPIYIKKGILPDIALGLQNAAPLTPPPED
jgi:MFS family permease